MHVAAAAVAAAELTQANTIICPQNATIRARIHAGGKDRSTCHLQEVPAVGAGVPFSAICFSSSIVCSQKNL